MSPLRNDKILFPLLLICYLYNHISAQQVKNVHEFYKKETNSAASTFTYKNGSQENYDVLFYHINVDVDIANKFIKGNVLCRFKTSQASTNQIEVDLDNVFTVDSINGSISFQKSENKLYVNLTDPINQGETGEITIYYHGFPRLLNKTKGLRFETHGINSPVVVNLSTPFLAHLWWPCKDGPSDKADSVYIDITIPDVKYNNLPLIAVSNGLLDATTTENGKKTFSWRERYPIVPYYVMMAISNYKFLQQDNTSTNEPNFPIHYYFFAEHESLVRKVFTPFQEAINLFQQYFGSYPFNKEKYAMTEIGFYGAIENQTNTIINSINMNYLYTIVHEFAHMWFGDMITCRSWNDAWLNEGFATYSELLFAEYTQGAEGYKNLIKYTQYFDKGTIYLDNISDPFQIFIPIIYNKGASVLHMLRGILGDDKFFEALKIYSSKEEFKYKHAATNDFKEICETIYSNNLSFFFDQWIYDEYYPCYEHYMSYKNENDYILNIAQTQIDSGWRPVFEMPVQVKLNFADGLDTLVTILNNKQTQDFTFNFNKKIINYELDPEEWILKKSQKVFDEIFAINYIAAIPANYNLFQNYPNPFNSTTNIEFKVSKKTLVKLFISDILGRTVTTILNKELEPDNYSIKFKPTNLASGVYFYTLIADHFFESRKMILLK